MRICLVSYQYPPETAEGGIGTQTWNKAEALTKLGHEVEVLTCSDGRAGEALRTAEESGIVVHRMRRPGDAPDAPVLLQSETTFLLGYTWFVLENLHRLHARRPFDLVNFPEYGAEGVAFLTNRTPRSWIPAVVQLHAPMAMLTDRMGWPEKDSTLYRVMVALEGEAIRLADGWMASSANIADFSSDFYGIPRESIDVVHCGIDCDVFQPSGAAPGPHRPTVLFVGNITESKGAGTLFEAVLRLRERFPDILLRLVGKENDLIKKLVSRAHAAGAADSFEWVPFVRGREAIVTLYQQADVFASPADQENGVANTYVEAMACGCPVIAGNTGGSAEAVTDSVSGFLVPPRDVDATAHAIERILGDPGLRRRMSAAARERAVSYFAQDRYIGRVLAAYERTIGQSRAALARLEAEPA